MKKSKYTYLKELDEMTILELKEQRSLWLDQAADQDDIEACRIVGRELGQAYEYRPGKFLVRWQSGKVVVDYFEMEGNYMRARGEYSKDTVVTVSLGLLTAKTGKKWSDHNQRVVYFAYGDNLTDRASKNIFIPGPWLQHIQDAVPEAEAMRERREQSIDNIERTKLLKLMQAGQEA